MKKNNNNKDIIKKFAVTSSLVGILGSTGGELANSLIAQASTNEENVKSRSVNEVLIDAIPVYNSLEEWEKSGDNSELVRVKNTSNPYARYLGGYTEYKLVDTKNDNDERVGYHPDFPNWEYWDGYYFSTKSKTSFSPSVSLTWGTVSVGISVASGAKSSGTFKKADGSRRSRPWVRADITTKIYDMYIYNEFGQLLTVSKGGHRVSTSSDIQIFIDHR